MRDNSDSDLNRKITIAKLMLLGNSCRNCNRSVRSGTALACPLTDTIIEDPFITCCEHWRGRAGLKGIPLTGTAE